MTEAWKLNDHNAVAGAQARGEKEKTVIRDTFGIAMLTVLVAQPAAAQMISTFEKMYAKGS
jgi:hypothetical protein